MEQRMRESRYLQIYNPFFKSFNNIKIYQTLVYINISNSMIITLPKDLGNLPCLRKINLSQNYLGISGQTRWPWIEQHAIRKTLKFLNLSKNSLTKLPLEIGKLKVLDSLNLCHNMLVRLPQTIAKLKHLKYLDVSHNKLLYLPARIMTDLNLRHINLSENSFQRKKDTIDKISRPLSLVRLSANVVLRYRIIYDIEGLLPNTLVEYLNNMDRCCLCGYGGSYMFKRCYTPPYFSVPEDYMQQRKLKFIPVLEHVCCYPLCVNELN